MHLRAIVGFLFVLKIRGKKLFFFFSRDWGLKKIAVGGSERGVVPPSVLGVRSTR